MPIVNRNATPTNFGFQYQMNIAIYFMFKYLKELKSIRVEGEKEDVEITFDNDIKYMIQAKSNATDIYNNSNNISKLNKALKSLSEADGHNVGKLMYASNMANPLNTTSSEFEFNGVVIKAYDELSPVSKNQIDSQIFKIIDSSNEDEKKLYNIDKEKLVIVRIPFDGFDVDEKHKYILEELLQTLAMLSDTLTNKRKSILLYWESRFLNNGATNPKIVISKNEICNSLILTEVDSMDFSNDFNNLEIDESEYFCAYQKYQKFVDDKIDKYESITKVYSLYKKAKLKQDINIYDFIKKEKLELYNYFYNKNIIDESDVSSNEKLDLFVSQIISLAILKKQHYIEKIRKELVM